MLQATGNYRAAVPEAQARKRARGSTRDLGDLRRGVSRNWRNQRMHRYLQAALDEIEAAAGHLDSRALARPVEARWSIAEILEHLTLAFTLNRAAMEKVLASGEPRGRPPKPVQWLGRVLVLDLGRFPRAEAPELTKPTGSITADRSLAVIRDALNGLDEALTRAGQTFGEHVRVANHPYFAGLTVAQWRKFHWRHTCHHMRQVRERAAPPRAPAATADR